MSIEDIEITTPNEGDEYDLIVDLLAMAEDFKAGLISGLKTAGTIMVADADERDALFADPVQGNRVWRGDLGYTETYYETYDANTNPGGKTAAGWARDGWQDPILPISRGGTGSNSKSGARGNLGFTMSYSDPTGGDDGDIHFKLV